ncbi:cytochrome b [Sphingomonas sp. H39-1-10]|uniref:cytochrome b n=1 Tax=Sphingomonas pollutisoli TaxID=3030829 RepID=UPI0023B8E3DB|nr:cytochrome b [Sphingomonas pollutisoli]MDF0490134.1 cytochrome b [Sphingomonas pollutisoli]
MSHGNRTHFSILLRLIHWTMAALILAMIFIGVGMVSTVGPAYSALLQMHRPIGAALFVLVVLRLAVRLATGAPALPADLPKAQQFVAKASHVLLYAAMLTMPLIGWAMLSAGGFPIVLTKALSLPAILPHDLRLYFPLRTLHTLVAIAFFALILAHLSAALMHGLIRRDGVLRSMTFGSGRREPIMSPQVDDLDATE